MKQLIAPNGKHIIGTAENIVATALVRGWSEHGAPIYQGSTEIDWNSQLTKTGADNQMIVVDEDGNEHSFADCNWAAEDEG